LATLPITYPTWWFQNYFKVAELGRPGWRRRVFGAFLKGVDGGLIGEIGQEIGHLRFLGI
jgi:hypothetical protein